VSSSAPGGDARRGEAARKARDYAARGDLQAALRVAVGGDAFETAAEILLRQARPGAAARMAMLGLGPDVGRLAQAGAESRALAARAAEWFRSAGEPRLAVDLLLALGDTKAAQALAQEARLGGDAIAAAEGGAAGLLQLCRDAAQLAEQWGRTAVGAQLLEALGAFGEAALAYLAAGEKQRSLAALMRVVPQDEQYRPACVRAVSLAADMGELGIVLEQFLSRFVRTGPLSLVEVDAFYRLGLLYERQGALGNAEEALRRLVAIRPDYRDAATVLTRVQHARHAAPAGAASILAEEQAFHQRPRRAPSPPAAGVPSWEHGRVDDAETERLASEVLPPGLPFGEGAVVADRYRIGRVIGRGGMSVVFEATDLELDDIVALKVFIHPIEGEELMKRFKRELQLSRQLVHGNILRLHDMGIHLGYRFVSMERLLGGDLRKRLAAGRPELKAAVDYLTQASCGLDAAHGVNVVHRDIKPENLFVTDSGTLKIMDFGIAKVMSAPNVTLGGVIWGTPRYMSPEQIKSFSNVTAASDLYSLGIVAYELVVGHVPFDHPDLTELLMLHLRETPLRPRELRPEIPEALDELIFALLAKDPAQRPASARECADRLRAALP
jgi:tetratricopeptide (TPR) repeat protein